MGRYQPGVETPRAEPRNALQTGLPSIPAKRAPTWRLYFNPAIQSDDAVAAFRWRQQARPDLWSEIAPKAKRANGRTTLVLVYANADKAQVTYLAEDAASRAPPTPGSVRRIIVESAADHKQAKKKKQ